MFSGIINIDKPVGLTSFQVVGKIRKLLGVKKVGHCGTLDPFASGVLPVCVGKATRVVRYMDGYDKEYRCTVLFGAFTDTQDREGKIIGGRLPSRDELDQLAAGDFAGLRKLFADLPGEKDQMPPMYSAIKMGGRPLYEYARQGISVERLTRKIHIYSCDVHDISAEDQLSADFSVVCSKGTYIRTLCNELGVETGLGAYADALRRTRCGPFSVADSFSLDKIQELAEQGQYDSFLLPEDLAVSHMPRVDITDDEEKDIRMGRQLPLELFADRLSRTGSADMNERMLFCAFCKDKFVAVVLPDEKEERGILRIERVLA